MKLALRVVSCAATVVAISMFGSSGVSAQTQTITINGCGSLTSTGGTGNIIINCTAAQKSDGAPSCTGLTVNPPDSTNNPSNIVLTAVCSSGANAIKTYTFSGSGLNPAPQTGPSLTIPAPSASTQYSVTASDGTLTSQQAFGSFTVGTSGGVAGAVDLSACTAQGFKGIFIDLQPNSPRIYQTTFGNKDALVFRVPPAGIGQTSALQIGYVGGSPQVWRIETLATQPCQIATSAGSSGSIIASQFLQTPKLSWTAGQSTSVAALTGKVTVAAGQSYYVTVVNRNSYSDTAGSCTKYSSCGVYADFFY